jgi:polyphenol oxidase
VGFERRELGRGAAALVDTDLEGIGVLAAFTERAGGSSAPPFDSLNVSFSIGDDPRAVRANRRRIVEGLGIQPFAVPGLVHGAKLARIGGKRAGAGFDGPGGVIRGADGLVTASLGVPIAVTSADCVPLVLASAREPSVVVVHAGWRGLAGRILDRAAAVFERPESVVASICPAIGPDHYDVGEDVALAVAAGSGGAVTGRHAGRLTLDLVATVARTLRAAGIGRVADTGLCTACERDRFFSHRRDGTTGRQAAIGMRVDA